MDRILCVEEEIQAGTLSCEILQEAGYHVQRAYNGVDGFYYAMDKSFDLVLIDQCLSDMDALELCRRIREEKKVPVFLIVRKREEECEELYLRALEMGADDLIFPGSKVFLARVKAMLDLYHRLRETSCSSADVNPAADLKLDSYARQVWLHGKEILLTEKEFDLLSFFMEHQGRILSKKEIFQNVWGMESLGDNATVNVFVRRVREKLGKADPSVHCIETVWGKGYRFHL